MSEEGRDSGSFRRTLSTTERERARQIVASAWADLPSSHRTLLEAVGAHQYEVVDAPLGGCISNFRRSAGLGALERSTCVDLDFALGVWDPELRVVVINAGHKELEGLDESTHEAVLARIAWHEWGHALSIARASAEDVSAGACLLERLPDGVAGFVRGSGYRRAEYTHEIVAEIYALLMSRRRRGIGHKPPWLDDRLYDLLRRVTGWNESQ